MIARDAYDDCIERATELMALGRHGEAFPLLGRAHVLGQAFVVPHTRVHWRRWGRVVEWMS